VLDTIGERGLAWRETDDADTERATLVRDLLDGQYEDPVRIVAFNTSNGWSRDVTEDIAEELQEYCADLDEIPVYLQDFLERHPSASRSVALRTRLDMPGQNGRGHRATSRS
jgi:hypothetical protein